MSGYSEEAAELEATLTRATDAQLASPDWLLNMTVCDLVSANPALIDDAIRQLTRRLQCGHPRPCFLALVLSETMVKNGSNAVHAQIASRSFLNEVAALTDGSLGVDVQQKALTLIKQWAEAFGGTNYSTFQDVYRQLKMQGVEFPDTENDVPVFTPPSSSTRAVHTVESSRGTQGRSREEQLAKLQADLKVVMEKIETMRRLRAQGENRTELEDVIDFLRQCQPRMNTLIEGGIAGKIDEQMLEECLNVNDHLIKALEESREPLPATADLIHLDSPPRGRANDHGQAALTGAFGSLSVETDASQGSNRKPSSPMASTTLHSVDDEFDTFLSSQGSK